MIDNSCTYVRMPSRIFQNIEEKVVSIYKKLNIKHCPVNPFAIADAMGFSLVPYSKLRYDIASSLKQKGINGASFYNAVLNKSFIYYNDICVGEFQRFTIMHEIGHILSGHKEESELARKMANYFAAYALAPSPLIDYYECEDYMALVDVFAVSPQCASLCFDRYLRWKEYGGKIKQYEKELLDLFY